MSDERGVEKISCFTRWQRMILRTLGMALVRIIYRVRRVDPINVPASGGVLLLPNHVTFADAFFITAACPRPVRFVMDDAFMAHPAIRWFCNVFNTVTIRKEQSREALRITIQAINNGDVVCFFPEGQLSRTGTLNELKRGVELIAKKANAALVPLWMDGAWGSAFSFERNRFFSKMPYRLPHPMTAAFGVKIPASEVNLESIRAGILKAGAAALRHRFPPSASTVQINGYQIGQINALARRKPFAALKGDPVVNELPAIFEGFSGEFGSLVELRESIGGNCKSWIGGEKLRHALAESPGGMEIDFYDFSDLALQPFEKSGVDHFPCLAVDGRVISMSMADPPQPHPGSEIQLGHKAGTWGKLLPGWYVEDGQVKGPAAGESGLPLPDGAVFDAEGFIAADASPGLSFPEAVLGLASR